MPKITIERAETEADFDAARVLSFSWADWHWHEYPDHRALIENAFEPVAYRATVADLHNIHARPQGAILLAKIDTKPVGCVMYHEMEPGVAEIKRLYVETDGRGHRLGQKLLATMFEHMRDDGYKTVRFSSARFLTHARSLYVATGFKDIPHPDDFPKALHDDVYFMEMPL